MNTYEINISGALELSESNMDVFKSSLLPFPWNNLASKSKNLLINKVIYQNKEFELILSDAKELARLCPFLNIKAIFTENSSLAEKILFTLIINKGHVGFIK